MEKSELLTNRMICICRVFKETQVAWLILFEESEMPILQFKN